MEICGLAWKAEEWRFFAEGGAHILFEKINPEEGYANKLLRVSFLSQASREDLVDYVAQLEHIYIPVFNRSSILSPRIVCLANKFVSDLFKSRHIPFAPSLPLSYAMLIENVLPKDGLTIEIKPKCALPERPGLPCRLVLQESASSAEPYNPAELFPGNLNNLESAVRKIMSTRFCRVFSKTWKFQVVFDLLLNFFARPEIQEILGGLQNLQKCGTEEFAKVALELTKKFPGFSQTREISRFSDPAKFLAAGKSAETVEFAGAWIRRFLVARSAMDVSFIVNFQEEISRLTVVDLDLKPASKIPFYATQFENSLRYKDFARL